MKRILSALLSLLLCAALPTLSHAACGHAAISSTASTIIAANDVKDAQGNSLPGRHGLCIYNSGTSNAMSFSIANQGLPSWQANHVYAQGTLIVDSNGNTERVSTAGTSGAAAPSWVTVQNTTTTDNTATWTLMQIGVAALAADWTLLPSAANAGVESFECFTAVGNALVPGGVVSAISASGTNAAWCSW